MRITESMVTRTLIDNINTNRSEMHEQQNDISTGKKIEQASDGPVRFSRANRFKSQIQKNREYLETISGAKGWINTTLSSLEQMSSKIVNAKDMAIQGADASYSKEQRENMAEQVDDLIKDMVASANATYNGKNLFAGTKTMIDSPFNYNGNSITYNGNASNINRRIAENYNVGINVRGTNLTESGVFDSMIDLKKGLKNNNVDEIKNSIKSLENAANNISNISASMGSLLKQVRNTENRIESANINLEGHLSDTQDTDMAKAIIDYTSEERAYKAALQTTSDIINLNLLNHLR